MTRPLKSEKLANFNTYLTALAQIVAPNKKRLPFTIYFKLLYEDAGILIVDGHEIGHLDTEECMLLYGYLQNKQKRHFDDLTRETAEEKTEDNKVL